MGGKKCYAESILVSHGGGGRNVCYDGGSRVYIYIYGTNLYGRPKGNPKPFQDSPSSRSPIARLAKAAQRPRHPGQRAWNGPNGLKVADGYIYIYIYIHNIYIYIFIYIYIHVSLGSLHISVCLYVLALCVCVFVILCCRFLKHVFSTNRVICLSWMPSDVQLDPVLAYLVLILFLASVSVCVCMCQVFKSFDHTC